MWCYYDAITITILTLPVVVINITHIKKIYLTQGLIVTVINDGINARVNYPRQKLKII
tara:strand:+ start:662 stop:835 length:174 start_codon:yes stop_codon:yes gene_type:complete